MNCCHLGGAAALVARRARQGGRHRPRHCCLAALLSALCRAGGGSGRMALITRNTTKPAAEQWRITGEYPGGVSGAEDEKFNPHGFDRNGNTMVTADYIVVSSTWDRLFGLIRARPT